MYTIYTNMYIYSIHNHFSSFSETFFDPLALGKLCRSSFRTQTTEVNHFQAIIRQLTDLVKRVAVQEAHQSQQIFTSAGQPAEDGAR